MTDASENIDLQEGLRQSAAGETVSLGSFAKYADDIDLDELERLAKKATPGPWVADPPSAYDTDDFGGYQMQSCVRKFDSGSITWDDHSGEVFTPADAEFIAATDPDTVLALVSRIKWLESALADEIRKKRVAGAYRDDVRERLRKAEARIEKVVRLRDRMEQQRDDIDESVRLSTILVDLNAALTERDEQ